MTKTLRRLTAIVVIISSLTTFAQSTNWKIQFQKSVVPACASPMGMTSDGQQLYTGSIAKAMIYTINYQSQTIDSTTVTGLPKSSNVGIFCMGLAYDGKNLYIANGNGTIYKLNEKKDSVIATIELPKGAHAGALAYDASADNGKGGFWTALQAEDIRLYSRDGILLNSISAKDLSYTYDIWGLAIDTTDAATPHLYALERHPQNAIRINIKEKNIDAPIKRVVSSTSELSSKYCYGIYIAPNVFSTGTTTLGVFFMCGVHIGFDFSTVNKLQGDAIQLHSTNMTSYNKMNQPMTISANYVNLGLNALKECKMHYTINDGEEVVADLTGNYLDYVNGFTLNHPTTYTPTQEGKHSVKVWLTHINGIDSLSTEILSHNFTAFPIGVQRTVLHEAFSSATCNPCKAGNAALKKVLDGKENVVCIKYQMDWPGNGDPYYTTEGGTRRTYYGVQSVPFLKVDGNVYSGSTGNYSADKLKAEVEKPAQLELNSTFNYNGNKTFTATITGKALQGLGNKTRLFAALVEKETRNNIADEYLQQYGQAIFEANFDTTFYYVMKKFLTPISGQVIDLSKADNTISETFQYTFNGNYRLPKTATDAINLATEHSVEDFNNIMLVYWVQDYTTKEVFQAGGNSSATVGIAEAGHTAQQVVIYPNPAYNVLNIESDQMVQQVDIFNTMGQKVMTTNETSINVNNLSNGIYIIRIKTDEGTVTSKFIKK